jgi:Fur family transcriptional regulator, ferric uptake regulator
MPSAPLRTTRQRSAVLAELVRAEEFLSAQELHARLRASGQGVGLSTVYRTVQALAATDEVDVIVRPEGEALYRACASSAPEHHHHLVCRVCGRAVEVVSDPVERWAQQVGSEHGFSEVTHTLEAFGVCTSCRG